MESSIQKDLRIEEYKMLRAEIAQHMDAQEKNILASITACGAALTFGLSQHLPFILLLAAAIPAYFWIQHINHRIATAKIAAYISIFIEGANTRLMWERRLRETHLGDKGEVSVRPPSWMRRFLLPYPTLIIGSFIAFYWEFRRTYLSSMSPALEAAAALIVFIITFGILRTAKRTDKPYSEMIQAWKDAYEGLRKRELIDKGDLESNAASNNGMHPTANSVAFKRETMS
jgi:chromate transport protein ChrA